MLETADSVETPLPPGVDPPLPTVTPSGVITPKLATDFNQLSSDIQKSTTLIGNIKSDIIGINNDGAASNLIDATSLENQGLADLASFKVTAKGVSSDFNLLESDLKAAGISDFTITEDGLKSFLAQLEANGFPADELQVFSDLGLSSDDINRILLDLQTIDLAQVPLSLYGVLDVAAADYAGAISPTPEPGTLALFGISLAMFYPLVRWGRRRRS